MSNLKQPLNLEKLNRRYSMPNSLRGSKISSVDFNRTRSLKLQKVKQPKTARSHFEPFQTQTQSFAEEGDFSIQKPFFATHTRILKGKPAERRRPDSDFGFMMEPPYAEEEEIEQQKKSPSRENRLYFYSANLQQRMNIYLNSLLNRSQEDHKQKLKEIETKILVPQPALKPINQIQNQFWRKMRRYKSVKKEEVLKEGSSWEFKIVNK